MVVNLKSIESALSMVSDIMMNNKQALSVLFDISDEEVRINYTDGNNVITKAIDAELEETDIKDKIVFDFKRLSNIIEACKPIGSIVTEEVQFVFSDNNICKIKAEKRIPYATEDGSEYKIVGVVDQAINWARPDSSMKYAVLTRADYTGMLNNDGDVDNWDKDELKSVLSKLSVENGKLAYLGPSMRSGFVNNTSSVIVIPLVTEIQHRVIQTTAVAKAVASILGKIDDGTILTYMLDDTTVVYATEDKKTVFSIKNNKQDNANVAQVNNCMKKDYNTHLLMFNKDVLYSCINGARVSSESDKIEISFKAEYVDDGEEKAVKSFKLLMSAKNTNKSIDNKYDVDVDYVMDPESTDGLKLNATIDLLHQAVNNINTPYVAFDIAISDNGQKMVRIAEADAEKRAKVSEANGLDAGASWTKEFMIEHRAEMLGYATYFQVAAD